MLKFPPKNILGLFDDVWKELNPFQVLFDAVEETKDNYRVEIDMRYINELVHIEVLEEAESLLELDIFARDGRFIVRGEYYVGDYLLAGILKVREVGFHAEFVPVWVKSNHVRFRIDSFRIWNKKKRKFDLVRWIARLFPYNRTLILKELVNLYPHILSLTKLQNEVRLNLNYFLNKAKLNSEVVKVHKVLLETNRLILFIRSTVVLKPLADFFGSDVVKVYSIPNQKMESGK
jgi:hypothetical protein